MDVNDMKGINDGLGHLAGDAALRAVGTALRNVTRITDMVGRLGGDEFIVVLAATDRDGVRIAASRVLAALAGLSFELGGRKHPFTASVGAAALARRPGGHDGRREPVGPRIEGTIRTLLDAADAEMYAHKRGSRDSGSALPSLTWSLSPRESSTPAN